MVFKTGSNNNTNDTADLSSAISTNASTSVVLSASNTLRMFWSMTNNSDADVWIKFQAASVDDDKKGILVPSCGYYELPSLVTYMGEISGIADDVAGDVHVVEF